MVYAKIMDGMVENTIVAEQDFIDTQEDTYVRIDNLDPIPGPGWLYENEAFTNPDAQEQPPAEPEGE